VGDVGGEDGDRRRGDVGVLVLLGICSVSLRIASVGDAGAPCSCMDEAEEEAVFVGVWFHGAWLALKTSGEAGFLYGSLSEGGLSLSKRKSKLRQINKTNKPHTHLLTLATTSRKLQHIFSSSTSHYPSDLSPR
jgi:hypothetical protein